MAKVVNYYSRLGDFGRTKYFNPNRSQGALIHPFRCIINAPSGNFKSNTVLNIINTGANMERIILVAANGKTEPLYKFLSHKLGKKLTVLDDIDDLPKLESEVTTKARNRPKRVVGKTRPGKDESEDAGASDSSDEPPGGDESGSESDESEPSREGIEDVKGKRQRLVIFEDMVFEGKRVEKIINTWFSRSRNANYSVILTTQHWFSCPRPVRLNANYAIFLKMSSLKEIKSVILDFNLGFMKPEQMVEAYKLATAEPSHFLLIDNQDPDPRHRIRKDFSEVINVDRGAL